MLQLDVSSAIGQLASRSAGLAGCGLGLPVFSLGLRAVQLAPGLNPGDHGVRQLGEVRVHRA